jgi:hypothetical protein
LYDLANNLFYTSNSGTHLIAGPKIESYEALEYIESTGAQYIDTGIAYNNNVKYETHLDYSYTTIDGTDQIMGFTGNYGMGMGITLTNNWWELGEKDINVSAVSAPMTNTRYNAIWTKGYNSMKRVANGMLISQRDSYNPVDASGKNMLLFAAYTTHSSTEIAYYCKTKLYSARIYAN